MAKYTSIGQGRGMNPLMNPLSNLRIEQDGEWKKLDTLLKYLKGGSHNRGIKRDIAKGQRDFLTGMKKNLISGLESGGSSIRANFAPRKNSKAPGSLGILDKNYLNALKSAPIKQKGYVVTLRMSKGASSYVPRDGGMSVGQYALIFEKGRKPSKEGNNQVARPLWSAAYHYTGGNTRMLNNMIGAVGNRLNKMGIKIRHSGYGYIK